MNAEMDATASVQVDFDVPARMRDGVVLRADVYRPSGVGPWPTLVVRTPYNKGGAADNVWNGFSPTEVARSGFIMVIQDVRGRYASDGVWEPLRHEGPDGFDTIAWAAQLAGSNGRVGMVGGSYCGNTQWQAAIQQPPALKAITPLMTWTDPSEALVARGGATQISVITSWSLAAGFDWLSRQRLTDKEMTDRVASLVEDFDGLESDGFWGLPITDLPVLRRYGTPVFVEPGAATDVDATQHMRVRGSHPRVQVPSLHSGGWYDSCLQGTIDNFTAMRDLGRESRLIIGPWTHEDFGNRIGAQDFGIMSSRNAGAHPNGSWSDEVLAFLRRHLTDDAPAITSAPVRIFVMGLNQWRDEDAWPLQRSRDVRWNLHPGGGLGAAELPLGAEPSEIDYDPADPVPTHGGTLGVGPGRGPIDQTLVESRPDVLTFTSAVLEENLEVTGRIRVRLHVQSTAPSTDWVARLCDVDPDGRSLNLTDGILRIDSGADEAQEIEIDLWSTSNVFLAGHRIRVQVTNSCFPRWDRNLNTGDQRGTEFVTAHQRLYHDASRPSYIELPVVPEEEERASGT
ncbi:CocE/NonD family hydrolase [Arthrobacter sp. ISL-48]|uniref:CocE/NonD family hydrolase n=1 Tax=Arthrobacter sp. ISL-48 TaxID=2819110 RepID=UPI001BE65AD3|nr:CocE/NonD family hydrolase [Arthrobacter sp. ISL-48]MBT2533730.1 CocE/NonD family hydrolase [Arthrobacter sp. ISL-48]